VACKQDRRYILSVTVEMYKQKKYFRMKKNNVERIIRKIKFMKSQHIPQFHVNHLLVESAQWTKTLLKY